MDHLNYTFEFIERYLSGELSLEEKQAFERDLKDDPSLAGQVEQHQLARKAVDLYAQVRTKDRIRAVFQKESHRAGGSRPFPLMKVAAAVALVLALSLVYLYLNRPYANSQLAGAYFEPYPDRITTMSDQAEQQLADAINAYNRSDFGNALQAFEALPDSVQQRALVRLYQGVCLLGLDRASDAAAQLEVLAEEESNYQEAAHWYLALAHLQEGDAAAARQLLQQIVSEDAYQSENAARLLRQLGHPVRRLPGMQ